MAVRVAVAHEEVLYKQSLASALSLFNDLVLVGQARYLEELEGLVESEWPDVVVASEQLFGTENRIKEVCMSFPRTNFIILTKDPEKALARPEKNFYYFLTMGYLIDLYRIIKLSLEERNYPQQAVIKNVFSHLKRLEDSGKDIDTFLLSLDKKKITLLIDIILGKGPEELCYKHNLTSEELDKILESLLKDIKLALNSA